MDQIELRCKILRFLIDGKMKLPGRFEPRNYKVRQAIAPNAKLEEYEEALLSLFAEDFVAGEDSHVKTFQGRIYRFYIETVTYAGHQFANEYCNARPEPRKSPIGFTS